MSLNSSAHDGMIDCTLVILEQGVALGQASEEKVGYEVRGLLPFDRHVAAVDEPASARYDVA